MEKIKKLPDTELEVMQALWTCTIPAKRNELNEILQKTHPMAQTTLLTMLTRLSEKNFILIEKEGRSSTYTPLVNEQEYLAAQSNRFLHKLCKGNLSVFATALCDSGLSKEEIEELRSLLEGE